jgi:hypothetical protein
MRASPQPPAAADAMHESRMQCMNRARSMRNMIAALLQLRGGCHLVISVVNVSFLLSP